MTKLSLDRKFGLLLDTDKPVSKGFAATQIKEDYIRPGETQLLLQVWIR